MRVGLTYDLRLEYLSAGYGEEETAEFDQPGTIDSLQQALETLGHVVDRIGHARNLITRLASGDRWDLVFNIAEGLNGIAREAQVPAILDVFGIPYTFSDPLVMSLTLHKGLTKTVIRDAGLPTADFAVVDSVNDVADVHHLPLPLFVKPIAEGTGKGVSPASKIDDYAALGPICSELLDRYQQPILVEAYLPGREFTVGLVGTGPSARVLGTLEIILKREAEPEVYSYVNKERCEEFVEYRLVRPSDAEVRQAEQLALSAWTTLGCRDAGRVDVRSDSLRRPHFLEVNPLAGLHPSHSDLPILCHQLGIAYVDLIDSIVQSASERLVVDAAGGRGRL